MFDEFINELKKMILEVHATLKTREFWIYLSVTVLFLLIFAAFVRLAMGFDYLTRSQMQLAFSCKTGEGQMATIIVGGIVFVIACLFTLGQVVSWGEENRSLRVKGRSRYAPVSFWKPLLHVIGTMVLGAVGYFLLSSWCS